MDSVEQLVERGIRVVEPPGAEIWKQLFLSSPNEAYQIMGANLYICKSWYEYSNISFDMLAEGGWSQVASFMDTYEIQWGRDLHPQGRGYWESKEVLSERRYFKHFLRWQTPEVSHLGAAS